MELAPLHSPTMMTCPAFPHSTAAVKPPTFSKPHNTTPPPNLFLYLAELLPDQDANVVSDS